ncbi:hypothetical protein LTR84_000086 [Exophiala bonariae]|uniref:NAD(P)-binding domain-containing protein n=1 Tax=Exophiala bonariae TaxID=1690606 RepID=A0AAV9NTB5_9EURO|nr:hypothetical protein LTR84_000086 [Exophiala bonariae]
MVHLILTGATGLVGSAVLSHILSLPGGLVTTAGNATTTTQKISKLTILSRSTTIPLLSSTPPPGTPRANTATEIEVVAHHDFSVYDGDVLAKLRGADACIWALGISQNDVDAAGYVTITRDYTLAAAKAFSTLRAPAPAPGPGQGSSESKTSSDDKKFKFIYISGEGATTTPRWYTPRFGRVKGETEAALLTLSQQSPYRDVLAVYSARPAGVDGLRQPWVWDPVMREKRSAFQRTYLRLLLPPIAWLLPSAHSPTEELGRALVEMAVDPSRGSFGSSEPGVSGEGRTLGNVKLRSLVGL